MSTDPTPPDTEDFERELEVLRAVLHRNLHRLEADSRRDKRLEFWLESARFASTNLEIWEKAGDPLKYDQAAERMRMVLAVLQKLVEELGEDEAGGSL